MLGSRRFTQAKRPQQVAERRSSLREQKKARTREALLESAGKLFARKGFDAAAMEEIAANAEVSTPSLYNYFPSKDDLLAGVLLANFAGGVERARSLINKPPRNAVQAFCDLARAHFENFDRIDRALLRRFTAHAILQRNVATAAYLGVESDLRRELADLAHRLQQLGSIGDNDPDDLAELVSAIANSEYYLYIVDDTFSHETVLKRMRKQLKCIF
jgi:AcrR family transcriptional regulator